MGCVSSTFLQHDDELPRTGLQIGNHIVSLTSTTYGLLTLDPPNVAPAIVSPPSPSPPRFAAAATPTSPDKPRTPEVINSWELMAGLDTNDSFRFSPLPLLSSRPSTPKIFTPKFNRMTSKENSNPNLHLSPRSGKNVPLLCPKPLYPADRKIDPSTEKESLHGFESLCPPNGENKVVLYTTTLRGVRKTFEACNSVRSAIEGLGFVICERDISMDRGFREELKQLMSGKECRELIPPRLFVKGRYIGGAQEVLAIHEEGRLVALLEGLPRAKAGQVCDGCGGLRFLPCFQCSGSCKTLIVVKGDDDSTTTTTTTAVPVDLRHRRKSVTVKCTDCNENGLVLCPICS